MCEIVGWPFGGDSVVPQAVVKLGSVTSQLQAASAAVSQAFKHLAVDQESLILQPGQRTYMAGDFAVAAGSANCGGSMYISFQLTAASSLQWRTVHRKKMSQN